MSVRFEASPETLTIAARRWHCSRQAHVDTYPLKEFGHCRGSNLPCQACVLGRSGSSRARYTVAIITATPPQQSDSDVLPRFLTKLKRTTGALSGPTCDVPEAVARADLWRSPHPCGKLARPAGLYSQKVLIEGRWFFSAINGERS
jgi:hypothetical protein